MQGDVRNFTVAYRDSDGNTIDLSDDATFLSITAQARIGGTLVGLSPTLNGTGLRLRLPGEALSGETIATGSTAEYDYDVQVIQTDGQSMTIFKGQLQVTNQGVTQTTWPAVHSTVTVADGSTS